MSEITLEQMAPPSRHEVNMEIVSASSLQVAEADLNDAIRYLQECRERLEKAMVNLNELRYHLEGK